MLKSHIKEMLKSHIKSVSISFVVSLGAASAVQAQEAPQEEIVTDTVVETPKPKTSRIKRVEEPVPYWVDAEQLRVRNNPYAGDVIGMLKIGQKVQVRKTMDDWVLISATNKPEQWINRNFLSKSPVTWASYNFESRGARNLNNSRFSDARYDVKLKRIKAKEIKGLRVYAADLKNLANDQKIVVSRHDYRAGAYYEKRLVQCDENAASHVKLLGEGYTVMMMEADPRMQRVGVPMSEGDKIENETMGLLDKAIAGFTCETDKL